ncbi:response regulator transcription factor [Vibrio astriarenae]
MTAKSSVDFESFLMEQSNRLTVCKPGDFETVFQQLALDALNWFDLDRMTLFPNSILLLNQGKSISVSRASIPTLDKRRFMVGNYTEYLTLLRRSHTFQCFNHIDLQQSKLDVLRLLHDEGGRWHGIIRLELFGQVWGALAFSRYHTKQEPLPQAQLDRLKLLCDSWLVFWQHSTISRSLKQDDTTHQNENENDKLLLLSKKQCKVLSLLAQGYTAKQCAEQLFLSPRTIESHKYRMLDLLDLDTHTELVQFALRNGLGID